MGNKRKICVATGTRAEYGQLSLLIKLLSEDDSIQRQLVVTGSHLSPEHGLTYREIEKDGFKIDRKVDIGLASDTPRGIASVMGSALVKFVDVFEELKPDIVVLLGDRYELFAIATAAFLVGLPIAHIAGGASTEGAMDEAFRHSISKMSHLHFACAEEERKRIIQLGEAPERVYNFGELTVDIMKHIKIMARDEFEESIGRKLNKKNIIVTFHPITLEIGQGEKQFRSLLEALDSLKDTLLIFTSPNADGDSRIIAEMIEEYVRRNHEKAIHFVSMGQLRYLSAIKYVDAVVGNSSSGLAEAPTFKTGSINIGDRQKGRLKAASVIDCETSKEAICAAFDKLYSDDFQKILKTVRNPYGEGGASVKIKEVLKSCELKNISKKSFYDINF